MKNAKLVHPPHTWQFLTIWLVFTCIHFITKDGSSEQGPADTTRTYMQALWYAMNFSDDVYSKSMLLQCTITVCITTAAVYNLLTIITRATPSGDYMGGYGAAAPLLFQHVFLHLLFYVIVTDWTVLFLKSLHCWYNNLVMVDSVNIINIYTVYNIYRTNWLRAACC